MPFVRVTTAVISAGLLTSLAATLLSPPAASADDSAPPPAVVVAAEDSALSVSWTPIVDDQAPISGYAISAMPASPETTVPAEVTTGADSTSAELPDLVNGVWYDVSVVAVKIDGSTLPEPATASGVPHTHPGQPVLTDAAPLDGSARVSWSEPDNGGAPVTAYLLEASPSGTTVSVPGTTHVAVVQGLANGAPSSLRVTAVNDAGGGQPSAPATVVPRKQAQLVLASKTAQVTYGAATAVGARVVSTSGQPVANTSVELRGRVARTSTWRTLAKATSNRDGRVTLRATLPAITALTLHHGADAVVTTDKSIGTANVAYGVSVGSRHPAVRVAHPVTAAGKVTPAQPKGTKVQLQRWAAGAWHTVATARTVAHSAYRTTWTPRQAAMYTLRVVRAGDALRTAGATRSWRQRVWPENAADIARQILHNRRVTLARVHESSVSDHATALQNLKDIAAGRLARRSAYQNAPGGSTRIAIDLLRAIRQMAKHHSVTVSEITGGSHAADSGHYAGRAVDVTVVDGRSVAGGASYAAIVSICRANGASTIFDPGYDPFGGHSNHVHCGW